MAGTSNKVIVSYPNAMRDAETNNLAQAIAEVPAVLAGRSRWLEEWATGGPAVSTDAPMIPRNPQGLYGHDHSGPPYGSCFRHTLFTFSGLRDNGSDWTRYTAESVSLALPRLWFRFRIWVRPFVSSSDGTAPYSRCYVDFRAVSDAGSVDTTWTIHANSKPAKTEVIAVTTTEQTQQLDGYLDVVPGWNTFSIEIEKDTTPGEVSIIAIAGSQIVKRSH